MAMTQDTTPTGQAFRASEIARVARKKFLGLGIMGALMAYFVYIFFAFDIIGLTERALGQCRDPCLRCGHLQNPCHPR